MLSVNEVLNHVLSATVDKPETGADRKHIKSTVIEKLLKEGIISERDLQDRLKSGYPRIPKVIEWAISHLNKAGLIENVRRGVYRITDEGKKVLGAGIKVDINYLKANYRNYKEWIGGKSSYSEVKDRGKTGESLILISPEEAIEDAYERLQDELKQKLLEKLKNISPQNFEGLILKLFRELGYGEPKETPQTRDDGVDGIVKSDKLGLDEIYIQAKRWSDNKVGARVVNEFIGVLTRKGASVGILITTSDFTPDAFRTVEEAKASGKKIVLINGDKLATLMIEHNVGVYVKSVYEIKDIDENFFEED
ncbi:MAG: restriction endonuclease [Hydrogenobacter sp.]